MMPTENFNEALKRTRKLAADVRALSAFDGHSSPPDWRPFVAELADELAGVIESLDSRRRTPKPMKRRR